MGTVKNIKLKDLVEYFRENGNFEKFCAQQSLDIDSEVIEIFGIKPFCLEMNLAFFPIEETEGAIQYTSGNTVYYNLFDFYFFLDAIEESKNSINIRFTNEQIAEKLISFAINDA